MPTIKPPKANMKIERTLDKVVILPDELIALITAHIEKETGRQLSGVPMIQHRNMGRQDGQYIVTAQLKDPA